MFSIYFSTDPIYNGNFLIGGKGYDINKFGKPGMTEQ